MSKTSSRKLPYLFQFDNGRKVKNATDWRLRREELHNAIVDPLYGGMPPVPAQTHVELLHPYFVSSKANGVHSHHSYRVIADSDRKLTFTMRVLAPVGDGPFPVIIYGDECWSYLTEEIVADVMARQCALALFNRVEIASDIYQPARDTGIYRLYPDGKFGALAAWAWGYHRCVDALLRLDDVVDPYKYKHRIPLDTAKIAVLGHSRGGKATLLAGATDERIALTGANNSGSGGAGSYLFQGEGSETLRESLEGAPYWYNSEHIGKYVGRQAELPFDQHFLKALVAPRALLTTEALGDLWANPSGTWLTHMAAREAFLLLGAERKIGVFFREGVHCHSRADWTVFLDFLDWQFRGKSASCSFNETPFPGSQGEFTKYISSATVIRKGKTAPCRDSD